MLAFIVAILPALSFLIAKVSRQAIADQRQAGQALEAPRMRFLEGSPQFNRPFRLALDRSFLNVRSSSYSSPALSYLDKKGLSTEKFVGEYENLWRLLEHLQLQRDFVFEEYALRTFLTASSSEVLEAMGDKHGTDDFDDVERYKFLSEHGLAWYLQHYYVDPATALTQAHQYGRARELIYEALMRLQFRSIPLSRYLYIPEYDRVMLLAAIYSKPDALIGRDEILGLLLKIVGDGFPEPERFELEAHSFPSELIPLQKHFLGIYDFRSRNYEMAAKNFFVSAQTGRETYLRDLSSFMVVRSRFWAMHDSLIKLKTFLSATKANHFAAMLEEVGQPVQARNLRANIREYIALAKSDFTSMARLTRKSPNHSLARDRATFTIPPHTPGPIEVPSISPVMPLSPLLKH